MPKKKTLQLTDRAAELLPTLAVKYHEQGILVSRLIEEEADRREKAKAAELGDLAALRQQMLEMMQKIDALEHKGAPHERRSLQPGSPGPA